MITEANPSQPGQPDVVSPRPGRIALRSMILFLNTSQSLEITQASIPVVVRTWKGWGSLNDLGQVITETKMVLASFTAAGKYLQTFPDQQMEEITIGILHLWIDLNLHPALEQAIRRQLIKHIDGFNGKCKWGFRSCDPCFHFLTSRWWQASCKIQCYCVVGIFMGCKSFKAHIFWSL